MFKQNFDPAPIGRPSRAFAALLIAVVIVASWVPFDSAGASALVHSSARSAAMGGAYTSLARGVDAAKYNPANLGLDGYRQFGVELASVGASVTNNSFSLADYNKYTGATLSTADKQDIMNKIPIEGLSLDADVRASALSVALNNLVFSIQGVGAADLNLNRDLVDLILNGNTFADTINVDGSYSDAISYASANVSYGTPIYSRGKRQLAVGFTAKYIKGIAVEELVRLQGLAATYETGFEGHGEAVIRTATGGRGYGLDVGASLKFNDMYTVGLRLENVIGSISWNNETEEHGYVFAFDTATADDFDEDFVTSDDYTKPIESFSTSLPAVMNVGLARQSGRLRLAIDWTQGFRADPGTSTKPRLNMGGEYMAFEFLPLRAGFMTGGDRTTAFSFGSGVRFFGFYLDAAVITGSSLSVYSAKGANVAFATGILF